MINSMALDWKHGLMVQSMRENTRMEKRMEKGLCTLQIHLSIMVNLKIMRLKGMESTNGLMEEFLKV